MQQSFRMEEYAHKTFQTLHDLKLNSDFEIQLIDTFQVLSMHQNIQTKVSPQSINRIFAKATPQDFPISKDF